MHLAATFCILGVSLLGYSFTLSPYKDTALFNSKYMEMTSGQSEAFYKLRDEMLTSKYRLEDYGISLLVLALLVFFIHRKKSMKTSALSSRYWLIAFAISLPFITVAGYVYDLFNAQNRGEFPHWADTLAIPLMGVPFILISLLVWVVVHLGFLYGAYPTTANIDRESFTKTNFWLKFVIVVAVLLVISTFALGQYWYGIPSLGWVYFYLSLAAVGVAKKE